MARITVEDCIDKFDSRFELVLVASNRARKLHSGEMPTVEKDNDKNTVIALREIADETISANDFKQSLIQEYQSVSPVDDEELALEFNEDNSNEINESKDNLDLTVDDGNANTSNKFTEDEVENNDDESSNDTNEIENS